MLYIFFAFAFFIIIFDLFHELSAYLWKYFQLVYFIPGTFCYHMHLYNGTDCLTFYNLVYNIVIIKD